VHVVNRQEMIDIVEDPQEARSKVAINLQSFPYFVVLELKKEHGKRKKEQDPGECLY